MIPIIAGLILAQAGPVQVEVFSSGQEGAHTYRIPSVIATAKGTLLAFCEKRIKGSGDAGDIDLVLRRSTDGGSTWGPMQMVWDDGTNTCGNPCPVVDRATGTIWLLLTHNLGTDSEGAIVKGSAKGSRTVWISKSSDDGASWSKPAEITKDVKPPAWTWFATGPGVGIQLKGGRLAVPCDSKNLGGKIGYSFVIYSDDQGASWRAGGTVGDAWNECQVAELSDGALMLNMRNHERSRRARGVALSRDGGLTWTEAKPDPALIEPVCQAGLLRLDPGRLLFSNPASSKSREKLTVRSSTDDGKSWPASRTIHEGPAAYSCLVALPEASIGCLYERGDKKAYEKITFARFTLAWLLTPP